VSRKVKALAFSPASGPMLYIKSTLVGVFTFVIATIAYIIIASAVFMRKYAPPPGTEVGFDLSTLLTRPLFWLIAIAAFALGFYWQFHRT
jgi:hypothetical protein